MAIEFYNTATRKVEEFKPLNPPYVSMYSCGMTVYYNAHIGHIRSYLTSDVLKRFLEFEGYKVQHVMNVTDVGHMVSDADEGEDKLEVGAKREGKSPWEIARFYEDDFFKTIREVNILAPNIISRATEHIGEMIGLIKKLEQRGYTYQTDVGIIYDTSKFATYADFAGLNLEGQNAGARVKVDDQRKQPWDFALWVVNKPNHIMQWNSPWGKGFPGWHIECSAMCSRYLGDQVDIHTGGIDHIPIHHTNEIAQSEGASGKKFVNLWVHTDFLKVNSVKMSKSLNNLFTIDDIKHRGFTPLALRYLYFGSSYRKQLDFTWESLEFAQNSLIKLWNACEAMPAPSGELLTDYIAEFSKAMGDDLNTSQALAVLWKIVDSKEKPAAKARTLYHIDRVLGLDLSNARWHLSNLISLQGIDINTRIQAEKLAEQREELRKAKNYKDADAVRSEITKLGFVVEDAVDGFKLRLASYGMKNMDEKE